MRTERRWHQRIPLNMGVSLYYGGLGIVQCRTRNISMDGMFVETGRIVLCRNHSTQLVFSGYAGRHIKQHKLDINIARVDDDGAGLAFENVEAGAYRFLQELLGSHRYMPEHQPLPANYSS